MEFICIFLNFLFGVFFSIFSDILKHRDLEKEIDGKSLGSLLPEDVIKQLESQYVSSREVRRFSKGVMKGRPF